MSRFTKFTKLEIYEKERYRVTEKSDFATFVPLSITTWFFNGFLKNFQQ